MNFMNFHDESLTTVIFEFSWNFMKCHAFFSYALGFTGTNGFHDSMISGSIVPFTRAIFNGPCPPWVILKRKLQLFDIHQGGRSGPMHTLHSSKTRGIGSTQSRVGP